jgi:hypothetical protein
MRLTDDSTVAYVIPRTQSFAPNVTGRARRGLHRADPGSDRGDPAHSRGTRCDRDRADGHGKNGCDPKPLPKPWIDPVTNQPLLPPTDLKGKMFLRKYDPRLSEMRWSYPVVFSRINLEWIKSVDKRKLQGQILSRFS